MLYRSKANSVFCSVTCQHNICPCTETHMDCGSGLWLLAIYNSIRRWNWCIGNGGHVGHFPDGLIKYGREEVEGAFCVVRMAHWLVQHSDVSDGSCRCRMPWFDRRCIMTANSSPQAGMLQSCMSVHVSHWTAAG